MTSDFSEFRESLLRQDESARLSAEAELTEAQRAASEAAKTAQAMDFEQARLAAALQTDAARVAVAAKGRQLPQDAVIGRLLPRRVGWLVSVEGHSDDNGGEGYNYHCWYSIDATVLTGEGKLARAEPVIVHKWDQQSTKSALVRSLRRSSGITEITRVNEAYYNFFRTQLARFTIAKALDI